MDGHSSHMTANFIAFYMEYLIDLLILFLHILHLFQLFDVSVFVLLKCTLVEEIDAVFQLNFGCISHAN